MDLTFNPAACNAVIALSRPDPGPLTRTSISLTPNLSARSAACCAAHWPAKGVLFRLPLNWQVPALDQQSVSPRVSVIVTTVLLNEALTCAMATVTLRRVFLFLPFATVNLFAEMLRSLNSQSPSGKLPKKVADRNYNTPLYPMETAHPMETAYPIGRSRPSD